MTEAAEQKEIDSGWGCFLYSGVASASATAAGGSDLVSIATGVLLLSVSISSSIEWKCYFHNAAAKVTVHLVSPQMLPP